ncbi:hypothetical protein [Sulfitobacter sp. 20_GPM-1509m]|uniref:hypothetical protein n=1 Tax=Sulfitobacter sp. 20_GPM-1509m TaxID=1380367 RepID=UPI00048D5D71|nr:hypothetical protein [Sulfitobacter sp. 20_GPM-1509m]
MPIRDEEIAEIDQFHRDANMQAMRTTGWKRRVHLAFARLFGWVGDIGREIQRDEQRGKDDTYHGEY